MLLVFALAAALCLQVFALSDNMSRLCERNSNAAAAVQNAAESIKLYHGSFEQAFACGEYTADICTLAYDAQWQPAEPQHAEYVITVTRVPTQQPLLGSAVICAQTPQGESIFAVTVFWQEDAHG